MSLAPIVSTVLTAASPVGEFVFGDVYGDHAAFVLRSLRRQGVAESALEDALQDVFVVVHRRRDSFNGRSSMRTWLYGIALRVARDHRRSASRRGVPTPLPDNLVDPSRAPDDELSRTESLLVVQSLLERLSDDQREVFVMVELEEMTVPQIAEVLDVNENTLYARLRAARADFERVTEQWRRSGR
jgi:RNA polymerase sigma-70 factor (ECF subfamily)